MSIGREWDAWTTVDVSVHLSLGVQLDSIIYPDDGRAVLRVQGGNFANLYLFTDRADLDRLADMVTDARDRLHTGMTEIEPTVTDAATTGADSTVAASTDAVASADAA